MKYELNERYSFCGFKNLPFVLKDHLRYNYRFFKKEQFELLFRCASQIDIDKEKLNDNEKKIIELALKENIIKETKETRESVVPSYQLYNNHVRKEVQWSITGACNFKCKHCFMSAPHAIFGEPSLQQCLDIINQMKQCGILQVGITGGEPLIRKDFWQIMDALKEADIKVSTIYSNGWLVDEKLLDEFEKRNMHPAWQISFDGIGTHDELRGVKGAEEKAIKAIKLLISRNYKVGSAYSIYRGNQDVFIDSLKLLADLGVCYVKTGYTSPQGEFAQHPELQLTNQEELEFYKKNIPAYIKAGRPIDLQCEGLFFGYSDSSMSHHNNLPYKFKREQEEKEEIAQKCDLCPVLRNHFYISAQGHVLPCMSMDGTAMGEKFPNLFETPLQEILTDSYYIDATDFRVKDYWKKREECANCQHRLVCLAGCRAMAAVNNSSDYFSIDERTCMMVKEDWAGQIKKCIEQK